MCIDIILWCDIRALGIKKILVPAIVFLSISVLISFGLTSNQAYAGVSAQNGGCDGLQEGDSCGSSTDTDCTNPDTCNAFFECQPNNEAEFFACGDQTVTECSDANSCNKVGTCLARNEPAGTSCNADSRECTQPDECDGSGVCVVGPSQCAVGGEIIPIGTTSLILAGTQSAFSWMIPITVSAVGIAIVIARKFSKYQPEWIEMKVWNCKL